MKTFSLPGMFLFFALVFMQPDIVYGQKSVLLSEMRHIRNTGSREWTEFAEKADSELTLNFAVESEAIDQTLELTQYDVKLQWKVLVNGTGIGTLIQDEKKTTTYFRIPATLLKTTDNVLTIRSEEKVPDDILVSGIAIHRGALDNLMTAAVDLTIVDELGTLVPGRITIINDKRSLQQFVVGSNKNVAARPGCLYEADAVPIRIPPGTYTMFGTRGFEYGVDSIILTLKAGDHVKHQFVVRREVDTDGLVAADTHVHTFTYSKHGDANLRERVLTLAGEGIELPVMTDHNIYVGVKPVVDSVVQDCPAVKLTPVVGDEVTTIVGHFNVLDVSITDPLIDYRGKNWSDVGKAITSVAPGNIVILNHARDDHDNFRPFDPSRHLSVVGVDRDGWKLPATAMEVINSGSQQSNYMVLFDDWFGMLNGGVNLTPVGSSDSHDVNRFIVGQGRTYVKVKDDDPGNIDIESAMRAMGKGEVLVSCGLLVKIFINQKYGPGELAKATKRVTVRLDVLGPSWSRAEVVSLYMNGSKIREERILVNPGAPIAQAFSWDIDLPPHDVFFAAIAEGKVGDTPFWPIAKPYQPASIEWTPRVYAGTGAVWVDGNGNGRRESAGTIAAGLLKQNTSSLAGLFSKLKSHDESVVSQVATLLWKNGEDLKSDKFRELLAKAPDHVRQGFGVVVKETSKLKR
ncbi:MAG: CehA/McbA family metallohydrolase [Chryseolinea sp.]